jgi:hypothetical protein
MLAIFTDGSRRRRVGPRRCFHDYKKTERLLVHALSRVPISYSTVQYSSLIVFSLANPRSHFYLRAATVGALAIKFRFLARVGTSIEMQPTSNE